MSNHSQVLADLAAENAALDALLTGLDDADWALPTPAEGWSVAHQVGHLTWTDRMSLAAVTAGQEWGLIKQLAGADVHGFANGELERMIGVAPGSVLHHWRDSRDRLHAALTAAPTGQRIEWFGPSMGPTSMATARLMETWAHGHDIADALGQSVPRTDRIVHVCELGVRTRAFSFAQRGLPEPTGQVRVELDLPSGRAWAHGPEDAADRVSGSAWDFARIVTRRVRPTDTAISTSGAAAAWLAVAQAFAGPPAEPPAQRPTGGS